MKTEVKTLMNVSLSGRLSKIRLQFGIQKNLHLTHTVLNQEQFQCANIVFACLWKRVSHVWGAIRGTGPRGVLGKRGTSTAEEVAVGLQHGTRAEGIHIHAPKAITQVKILH